MAKPFRIRYNTPMDRITTQPDVMCGKPCIRGTRIPVELLLEDLASGLSIPEILVQFPQLTREDVLAAIHFAGEAVHLQHPPLRLAG